MDAKEIKSALKEARDAIKNKDFAASVKICKVSMLLVSFFTTLLIVSVL